MRQIRLATKGVALVDNDKFQALNQYHWHWHKGYAARNSLVTASVYRKQFMHHLVLGVTGLPQILGIQADHIDGNRLNNQRVNLRVVSSKENNQNRAQHRAGKLVGVSRINSGYRLKPWRARMTIDGQEIHVGYFKTAQEAHNAYIKRTL